MMKWTEEKQTQVQFAVSDAGYASNEMYMLYSWSIFQCGWPLRTTAHL